MRDPETGNSRGFGFVSYDSFEASDAAIEVLLSNLLDTFYQFGEHFSYICIFHGLIWFLCWMCIAYIQSMNGQYLCNRQITVSYAYKKDTKGERHGTPAGIFLL